MSLPSRHLGGFKNLWTSWLSSIRKANPSASNVDRLLKKGKEDPGKLSYSQTLESKRLNTRTAALMQTYYGITPPSHWDLEKMDSEN